MALRRGVRSPGEVVLRPRAGPAKPRGLPACRSAGSQAASANTTRVALPRRPAGPLLPAYRVTSSPRRRWVPLGLPGLLRGRCGAPAPNLLPPPTGGTWPLHGRCGCPCPRTGGDPGVPRARRLLFTGGPIRPGLAGGRAWHREPGAQRAALAGPRGQRAGGGQLRPALNTCFPHAASLRPMCHCHTRRPQHAGPFRDRLRDGPLQVHGGRRRP